MFNVGDKVRLKSLDEIMKVYDYDLVKRTFKITDGEISVDYLNLFKDSRIKSIDEYSYILENSKGLEFILYKWDIDNLFENMDIITENNVSECKVKPDNVNHPAHYTNGKVECIDAIESATNDLKGYEAFLTGQVIKYVWRFKRKGKPLEDLQKAEWYLHKLMESVKGE